MSRKVKLPLEGSSYPREMWADYTVYEGKRGMGGIIQRSDPLEPKN